MALTCALFLDWAVTVAVAEMGIIQDEKETRTHKAIVPRKELKIDGWLMMDDRLA